MNLYYYANLQCKKYTIAKTNNKTAPPGEVQAFHARSHDTNKLQFRYLKYI